MYTPVVNPAVVEAVRLAFMRTKTSPVNWRQRQLSGRLVGRNAMRFEATGRPDIFRDRTNPGATKVNVHILVDGSGSMKGVVSGPNGEKKSRIAWAADCAATLTAAFQRSAQVSLNIWMHNTLNTQGDGVAIFPIVQNGGGRERIGLMPMNAGGGNGDGYAIQWVTERIKRERRKGEVNLIIVINDGLPSWLAVWNFNSDGTSHVFNVVKDARDSGIEVVSVAIDSLGEAQAQMYGEDVIPFNGDWNALVAEFGATFGSVLAHATRKNTGR